ncbi:hypothetical protein KR200_004175 [Drosophila serrata]|nr:hypothetical protein KR200_004175 [Drosophila serrata]
MDRLVPRPNSASACNRSSIQQPPAVQPEPQAASQAIMVTKQMLHGRRTTSLKAIYEAIHGPAGTTAEFCSRLQPEQSTAATSSAAGATSSTHHSAIMATKQMQHGRRTTSLKGIYEAIHGPDGTTAEFCSRLQPEQSSAATSGAAGTTSSQPSDNSHQTDAAWTQNDQSEGHLRSHPWTGWYHGQILLPPATRAVYSSHQRCSRSHKQLAPLSPTGLEAYSSQLSDNGHQTDAAWTQDDQSEGHL